MFPQCKWTDLEPDTTVKDRGDVIVTAGLYFGKLEVDKCKLKIGSLEVVVEFEQPETREDHRETGLEVLIWVLKVPELTSRLS